MKIRFHPQRNKKGGKETKGLDTGEEWDRILPLKDKFSCSVQNRLEGSD